MKNALVRFSNRCVNDVSKKHTELKWVFQPLIFYNFLFFLLKLSASGGQFAVGSFQFAICSFQSAVCNGLLILRLGALGSESKPLEKITRIQKNIPNYISTMSNYPSPTKVFFVIDIPDYNERSNAKKFLCSNKLKEF